MKQITIGSQNGKSISLDLLQLIDTKLLVQANSGGGKSWLLRLLAERAGDKLQTIILDNEGEFATLREKLDMVLVGSDGEIPANPRAAALLARRLLETQVSAVVDLYELKLPNRREFVKLFLDSLIHLPRELWRPTLVIIDEAHLYCPEKGSGEAESTDAVIALMSQGRKRGFCGVLATQRLSKLHKDAAAECNNVLIGRTALDNDQERAGKTLGMSTADRQELRNLDAGEWYGFGPAFSDRGVFRFRAQQVETTHPKAGERHNLTAPAPSAKVRAVLAKLADLPQKAEEEIRDLTAAKRQIAELKRELGKKHVASPPAAAATSPVTDRERERLKAEAKRETRAAWEPLLKERDTVIRELQANLVRIGRAVEKSHVGLEEIASVLGKEMPKLSVIPALEVMPVAPPPRREMPVAHRAAPVTRAASGNGAGAHGANVTLNKTQQRILDGLAWLESMGNDNPSNTQLGAVALIDTTGGHFSNTVGPLSTAGLVERGDGRTRLTDAGRAHARVPERASTIGEYHDVLRARILKMKSAGRRTIDILDYVISRGGEKVTTAEIGTAVGIDHTGGHFSNMIGPLSTAGVITRHDGVVSPTDVLFPEGLS